MDVLRKYPIELAPMTSEFVRHMACPHCGSSDAASLYDDGHIFVSDATPTHLVMAQTLFTLTKCVMSTTRLSRKAAETAYLRKNL